METKLSLNNASYAWLLQSIQRCHLETFARHGSNPCSSNNFIFHPMPDAPVLWFTYVPADENKREADWFDFFNFPRYINQCEKISRRV